MHEPTLRAVLFRLRSSSTRTRSWCVSLTLSGPNRVAVVVKPTEYVCPKKVLTRPSCKNKNNAECLLDFSVWWSCLVFEWWILYHYVVVNSFCPCYTQSPQLLQHNRSLHDVSLLRSYCSLFFSVDLSLIFFVANRQITAMQLLFHASFFGSANQNSVLILIFYCCDQYVPPTY